MAERKSPPASRRAFLAATGLSLPAMAAGRPVLAASQRAAPGEAIRATLTADAGEILHPLPKTQYGHFIEHLGHCIKGGIWAEGERLDLFLGGVRPELVEAIRSIHPALIRYPGGCFADGYHWKDGIGPRAGRPLRPNLAWGKLGPQAGPPENNHFGTDEFLQLCAAVGAEPMLTVNVGSGTAAEAADWVEYANGSSLTRWGGERKRNGHPAPYGVKDWFIGNEIFGFYEIGHLTPEQYVKVFREYARAMRAVDPSIKLIAVGNHFSRSKPSKMDINRQVLEGTAGEIDYLSVHQYVHTPRLTLEDFLRFQFVWAERNRSARFYYEILATAEEYRSFLDQTIATVRQSSPAGNPVPIAFDEWNVWYHSYQDIVQANYNLRDGLWCATVLNLLHQRAPDIPIANLAQMVNCLGLITSEPGGTFLTPSAWVFKLYAENAGTHLARFQVESPAVPHPSQMPAVDASVTVSEDRVALFLVNRHLEAPVELTGRLAGIRVEPEVQEQVLTHANPVQYNTLRQPEAVKPRSRMIQPVTGQSQDGLTLSVLLPPHSLTCLVLKRIA